MVRMWDDYRRLFRNAGTQAAVGEASVSYLWSKTAAGNIADKVPSAPDLNDPCNPIGAGVFLNHHDARDPRLGSERRFTNSYRSVCARTAIRSTS